MPLCNQCVELVDKLKQVKPHDALQLTDSRRWKTGMAKGAVEHYTCSTCGADWTRDTDKHDRHAGWATSGAG